MKRFSELTSEELVALEQEQIDLLIELEIAYAGIEPVIMPTKPTLEDLGIVKNDCYYQVGSMLFVKEEDALQVSGMDRVSEDYDCNIGYNYRYTKPVIDSAVSKVMYYKQEDITRVQPALARNKAKLNEYEPAMKAYNQYTKETSGIRQRVYSAISEARDLQEEIDLAKKQYDKYLVLADNNTEIAENFFRNTYKNKEYIIEKILPTKNVF